MAAAKLVYQPEGAEAREWAFDPDGMRSDTLEAIEDATGWTAAEWLDFLVRGSIKALRALLWVNLRKLEPGLDFGAVSFSATEIQFEFTEESGPKDSPTESAESGTGD